MIWKLATFDYYLFDLYSILSYL